MNDSNVLRPGEVATDAPQRADASLVFIGVIRTPWPSRSDCPRQGSLDGPICRLEIHPRWQDALLGIDEVERLEALYWLHQARRDLMVQRPLHSGVLRGTFALRSPVRPNPIGTSIVALIAREGAALLVRGLDCLDGTPLIDIKPDRSSSRRAESQ